MTIKLLINETRMLDGQKCQKNKKMLADFTLVILPISMDLSTILVVDDELDILSQLKYFLTDSGYNVITASDGMEGLKMFKQYEPAICLLDYKMPKMNGLDLLVNIKNHKPDTEVLLVSGNADMRVAVTAIKEHAFDFLPKPIDLRELSSKIEEAIANIETKKKLKMSMKRISLSLSFELLGDDKSITLVKANMDLDETGVKLMTEEFDRLFFENLITKKIVFMLSNVQRINNLGLNFLVDLNEKMNETGKKLILTKLRPEVSSYLNVLGYSTYFEIITDLSEIDDSFS